MSREPPRGRGTGACPPCRFHELVREAVDDGWPREAEPPPPTRLYTEAARSAISRNDSPDVPFDRSVNPYRGCEHGCIYCYARPGHAWLGFSPGLEFETHIVARPDLPDLLEREISAPGYECRPLALGTFTDAWQPVERRCRLTRAVLERLLALRHPVSVVTKSALVERDLDLLQALAAEGLVHVHLSVTTLDPGLARRLEPRAAAPRRRLQALAALAAAGIPAGVLVAPLIPVLTDGELERILEAAADAGAGFAGWVLLRLPGETGPLFEDWLRAHFPGRAEHVLARVREAHGGRLYDARFGRRMRGGGEYARLLGRRFALACRRLGLATAPPPLATDRLRRPHQLDLL